MCVHTARILKSGLLAKSHLESYFDEITAAQENVDRCSSMVGMQGKLARKEFYLQSSLLINLERLNQRMDLKKLLNCECRLLNSILESQLTSLASKRTVILRWMSSEPYLQHHEQTKKEVLSGTGQWLLSDLVFQRWKKESVSSLLWLHGIPGSGKSKLV